VVFAGGVGTETPEEQAKHHEGNLQLFAQEGFIPGPAFALDYRVEVNSSRAATERFVREVVATAPSLVLSPSGCARDFQRATASIPIVFYSFPANPVREGLVQSFQRPGANVTGTTLVFADEEEFKGWEILRELVPHARRLGVFWEPGELDDPQSAGERKAMKEAARRLGFDLVDIVLPRTFTVEGFARAVRDAKVDVVDAEFPIPAPLAQGLIKVLERARIPALWAHNGLVRAGGLLSANTSRSEAYREAFKIAALILRGADPATTPVRTPRRYLVAVNLKTARNMGLEVPQSLRLRADVVVE
jgi:putative ABC transport system substrate-binding protein